MDRINQKNEPLHYIPSAPKALEVILWLAHHGDGIDIYHVGKASFYADKFHVAKYGRPLVGDTYVAAQWGPLPRVIYGLLRSEPLDMLAAQGNGGPLPFKVDADFRVTAGRDANLQKLSESDIKALRHGLDAVKGKSFDDLVRETHRDPAYLNARARGVMDYRDFIPDDDEDRDEKVAYLEDAAGSDLVF